MRIPSGLLVALLLLFPGAGQADEARLTFGGDQYVAGQTASVTEPAARDAFAAGFDASLRAAVTGDGHLVGFNVASDAAVSGNLYAAGQAITITAPVGGDVTAFGNSITLRAPATVGGNVRLAGSTVNLSAPVSGSALITAQTLTLDTEIAGDLSFFGENLVFGPAAKVTGKVLIQAPREIAVPATVAAADRVTFTQLTGPDYVSQAGKTAEHVVNSVWPAVWATGIWWLLLFVVGVLFITLGTRLVVALEETTDTRLFRKFGLGILVFAAVIGLVPLFAMTVVGLFLLPIVLVFVAIAWILAYLAGAYLVVSKVARAITRVDTNLRRIGVLAAAIVIAGLIGLVPFLGWLVTLVLLAFGFGAFGALAIGRWGRDAPPRAAPAAFPETV